MNELLEDLGGEGLRGIGPLGDLRQAEALSFHTTGGKTNNSTDGILTGFGEHAFGWAKSTLYTR